MDLAKGAIGGEGSYDIEIADGKISISAGYEGADMGAALKISMPLKVWLDKLAAAIPGELDNAVIKALEAAVGL